MRQGAVAVGLGYQRLGSAPTVDVSGNRVIKEADCSLCGQCITHCPTGALRERDDTQKAYCCRLADPDRVTIVQIAPAVRAAWAEPSACRPARQATGKRLVCRSAQAGRNYVFDTTFPPI